MIYLILLVITLSFSIGFFEILGITSSVTELVVYLFVLFLFVRSTLNNLAKEHIFKARLIIIFTILVFIGATINKASLLLQLRLYIDLVIGPMFLYVVITIKNPIKLFNKYKNIIVLLLIVQLIAVTYKFIFVGIQEDYLIGTMSNAEGSLSVMFPLFVLAIIIPIMLYKFKFKYLFVIASTIYFSVVGDKRAMVLFFPLIFLVGYYFYSRFFLGKFLNLKKVFIAVSLGLVVIYIGVRTLPTLNPQNKVWGEFNFNYAGTYIIDYNAYGDTHRSGRDYSRLNAPMYFIEELANIDIKSLTFGMGPVLFNSKTLHTVSGGADQLGYGYQGRASFNYLLIQLGFLAVAIYLLYYFSLFRRVLFKVKFQADSQKKKLLISILIMFFIWILDFLFYSTVCINELSIVLSLHLLIGLVLRKDYNSNTNFNL